MVPVGPDRHGIDPNDEQCEPGETEEPPRTAEEPQDSHGMDGRAERWMDGKGRIHSVGLTEDRRISET